MKLLSIHRYPVKSLAGMALQRADIGALGIFGDRRFMLIDGAGRFITARERPELLRWTVDWFGEREIELQAPDGARHRPHVVSDCLRVRVWDDEFVAHATDAATADWIAGRLGASIRLVFVADPSPRPVDPKYGKSADRVGFADGYPLLLLSDASHQELEHRAGQALSILRFRPNLVVTADVPHAEDTWKRIRIGDCEFELVKPCVRCVLTTIDPVTAEPHPEREPLRTLIGYRRGDKGVTFGMNLIPRSPGTVRTGDEVLVLA